MFNEQNSVENYIRYANPKGLPGVRARPLSKQTFRVSDKEQP